MLNHSMKKQKILYVLLLINLFSGFAYSQETAVPDSLGLPGDNLNLAGVLDLFQKCATLEDFEKKLNSEESKLNNLDLNEDDKTDYIRVVDHAKGSAHAIALQIAINEKETQDVAVIEVDKDDKGEIIVQIIGDKELYGKDYILEPKKSTEKSEKVVTGIPNPGYKGNIKSDTVISEDGKTITINNTIINNNDNDNQTIPSEEIVEPIVVVALWPIMGFIFAPVYVPYVSPYYFGFYPPYWHPWPPVYFHMYHGYHHHAHGYYHRTVVYRAPHAHSYYGPRRTTSVVVVNKRNSGAYNKSYNRPANSEPSQKSDRPSQKNTNKQSERGNPGNAKPNTSKPGGNKPANNAAPSNRQKPATSQPNRNAAPKPQRQNPSAKPGKRR